MVGNREHMVDLIELIEECVGSLGDYLYPDKDAYVNKSFDKLDNWLYLLKESCKSEKTYVEVSVRGDGDSTTTFKHHFMNDDIFEVCRYAAKFYAFDDIDDTYKIVKIVCDNREIEYVGWQPCMLFEFRDVETKEIVYSNNFPHWDH